MGFHHGFNLYNIGFTGGIIGTFFIAILRAFGVAIDPVALISSGNNAGFSAILYSVFALMLLFGLYGNKWSLRGYGCILKEAGKLSTDFTAICGFSLTLVNMAFLGIIAVSYVLLVGGELNGPSIGGVLTVVGFAAFGKHIKNITPVLLGIFLMGVFNSNGFKLDLCDSCGLVRNDSCPYCRLLRADCRCDSRGSSYGDGYECGLSADEE
jgi:hypothetical protein